MKNVLVGWLKDSVLCAGRKVILVRIAQSKVRSKCIQLCFLRTHLSNRSYSKLPWLETLFEGLALMKLMLDRELDLLRLRSKLEKREDSVRACFKLRLSAEFRLRHSVPQARSCLNWNL